jgi:hypothetical protein
LKPPQTERISAGQKISVVNEDIPPFEKFEYQSDKSPIEV